MTIRSADDKIALVADEGRKSRELTDRRRGSGTTGGQQEISREIDKNNIKNHEVNW